MESLCKSNGSDDEAGSCRRALAVGSPMRSAGVRWVVYGVLGGVERKSEVCMVYSEAGEKLLLWVLL